MTKRPNQGSGRKGKSANRLNASGQDLSERKPKRSADDVLAQGLPEPAIPQYLHDPKLPPVLRFDPTGQSDKLHWLLDEALERPLKSDEVRLLADALKNHEPWLEWAGKHESTALEVTPVVLRVGECIKAQTVIEALIRRHTTEELPGGKEEPFPKAVRCYHHGNGRPNRLILGDSLQVMSSLSRTEDLADSVQMIYMDPPYGIKYAGKFSAQIRGRKGTGPAQDHSEEPEIVKAYRDSWNLGIHSYLTYLRQRLLAARELLASTGSLFMQMGDENLNVVRDIMDEVLGRSNFVSQISFATTTGFSSRYLSNVADHVLWYAKDISRMTFRPLFLEKRAGAPGGAKYRPLSEVHPELQLALDREEAAASDQITSQGSSSTPQRFEMEDRTFEPPAGMHWKTTVAGLNRLKEAGRLRIQGRLPRYIRLLKDFQVFPITNMWLDIGGVQDRSEGKLYAVQTASRVVERCLLMTTRPGDLVLDPTCGSGTTAHVAEKWGRRWIAVDTSRAAIAVSRKRMLTARYEHYELKDPEAGLSGGFRCRSVPHVRLKDIARNADLDPIFEKHRAVLDRKLAACNAVLSGIPERLRSRFERKLSEKERLHGKKSITEGDRRRWHLPETGWEHWHVPFDADSEYPSELSRAVGEYRMAWRAKMDEVNAIIEEEADQQELADQPRAVKGITRVTGPFSVESAQPHAAYSQDPAVYQARMLRLLRMDGVHFPHNKHVGFSRLNVLEDSDAGFHGEGRWLREGAEDDNSGGRASVCVVVGPQNGPVRAGSAERLVRAAVRQGYNDLVITGFGFEGTARQVGTEAQDHYLRVHFAHIRGDVSPSMNHLLTEDPGSQFFTVFGEPRTRLTGPDQKGDYTISVEGVDAYDPLDDSFQRLSHARIAAWFVDRDYDGEVFTVTQAFFPEKRAWTRLAKALRRVAGSDAFACFSGDVSLPFPAGTHRRAAVKVIDHRGNEVTIVHELR